MISHVGKVAAGVVDALRAQPALLVLVLLNLIVLAGAYLMIENLRVRGHEERMMILDRCMPVKAQ